MSNSQQPQQPRKQVAYIGNWNTMQLDYRSPVVIAFWSIAYAGLGHILLDRYFRGFIILTGEILLNLASHLNLAIFFTITRQFDSARQVLDTRWFLLYMAVFCFGIFDSYREAIVINNTYRLADRENADVKSFSINSNSFSVLNSISPYPVMLWSAILPGAGCFLLQRMNRALYLMVLWVFTAYLSGIFTSVIYTFSGQFEIAKQSLNVQWFLNFPSIWFFAIYESYNCAIENNKLFRREMTQFFQKNYQSPDFLMP